ncbi:putative thiamine-phosphate diphosphorylase [Leptospira inadai serovar Lyme str. 10]|uniref:Thiamine phosphate synthase n=2 Tax=Leptospira inadai serovar Lyme TaxID=293084 RepID=A0ABX4YID9_9LEPT|nr:thiamine phosphate synthase [Leptospira inadai]EQA36200.1 putative thiamine-phosphate diphosphorylase [Leptospira inadai serovar Lyme str. 10]PNV74914.1 thiamine phosphate synthase [Leptospira inadai serovar Lyme]
MNPNRKNLSSTIRPRVELWKAPGLYPILDLEYCSKFQKNPFELVSLWAKYRDYIPFFQLRAKKETVEQITILYRSLRETFPDFPVILNDHWKLALDLGSFGLHIGKEDYENLDQEARNRIRASELFLGTSSHCLADLSNIETGAWDYTGFGPIFDTSSKEKIHPVLGIAELSEALRLSSVPVTPIGGIGSETLPRILSKGNFLVAMISGAAETEDVLKSLRLLQESGTV